MAAASDPTPLSYQLQRANLELQPPLLASPTLHGHGSGRASPAAADRVEARRRRLWQGPGGAGGWRGFFLGPAERYEVQPPGQEYAINAKYWRRLWRITRMGLAEPGTALLAVLIVLTDLAQVMILSSTAIALGGTVSSMTLTYMRLLSPCSPVREAARRAGVPANISAAILAFQDEASRAAKANLWEPGEPYVGVGRGCALEPPPAWSQAFHLPADLWACSPPRGYMPGLGVVGSSFMWASVLLLLSVCGQLCGAALLVRTRLAVTKHLHSKLFARQAFYSTVVLSPTLDNPDQRITDDLNTTLTCGVGLIFGCLRTATGASLIYRVLNTIFNLAAAVVRMNALGGTIQRLFWTLALSSSLLAFLTFLIPMNRVSRLLYTVKKCEGNFRWLHCHLMEHSETVAFYAGEVHEEAAADQAFGRVYSTMAKLSLYGSVLAAFGAFFNAGIIPLMALSLIYFGRFEAGAVFIIWGNLNSGFGACLGIPELYTALSISGGPCHRVGVLIEWLDRQSDADEPDVRATGPRGWLRRVPRQAQGEPLLEGPGDREPQGAPNGESGVGGRSIELAGLCVAPPGAPGLVLFRGLTLTISPGDSTAIVGPSGCGKSSLLRVLAGLWQPLTGTVRLPSVHGCGLFFLPQRSYVRMGTLQNQVTYPIAFRDEHVDSVKEALTLVGLSNLQQERKLDEIVDWPTALGAGELQALAFARLLFHQPTFALMDEATSAMDLYSEARLMQLCGEKGITAISVCHRPSAAGFHKRLLRYTAQSTGMDGDPSSWKLLEVPREDRTNAGALAEAAPASPLDMRAQAARQALEGQSTPSEESAGLGRLFFHRFRHLFQLAIPTWRCWSAGCLYAILIANCCNGLFLICGTLFAGRIAADVSSLDTTGGQYPERTPWLLAYFCVAPVLLFLVAFTRAYCGQMLALHVRRCATDAGHLLYFGRTVAFAMNSRRDECLPGTGKWQPDQRLQQDLQLLCDTLGACLLGNASGDGLIGCSVQLMFGLIFACCLSWLVSSFVLGLIFGLLLLEYLSMVPVTRASMRVQQAEGAFRVTHARAREFAESIVFYGGQEAESTLLDSILVGQVAKRAYQAIGYAAGLILTANMVGTILATAPAILVSMVVFYWSPEDWGGSQITPQTLGSAQTFFSAIGSQTTMMVGAFASIGSLSGLTHRVGAFLEAASRASAFVQHELASPCSAQPEQGRICLQDVTVASWLRNCEVSPAGVLIDSLSVEVKAGNDLLIHGESGSGKSSLMRVMAGLYPSAGGVLKRPPLLSGNDERLGDSCMFVPQASYALGAQLRDEVAYPSAGPADEARARAALEAVGLGHLERREGMGRATSWASELSGGELQRLGLARVLYHRPAFALLDDATSALDAATERRCLGALRDAGVTLVTVSHREGPRAFHSQRLRLAGGRAGGKWVLEGEGGHQP